MKVLWYTLIIIQVNLNGAAMTMMVMVYGGIRNTMKNISSNVSEN